MLYAKSLPQKESIQEHTFKLLVRLKKFKQYYGNKMQVDEHFWLLIQLAALVHDFGKANVLFQNKIRQKLGEPKLPCNLQPHEEIPHNYLSVAFLPYSQLDLPEDEWKLLVYAVGYHHEREEKPDRKQILQFLGQAFPEFLLEELCSDFSLLDFFEVDFLKSVNWKNAFAKPSNKLLNILQKRDENSYSIKHNQNFFRQYVVLKGLLHRLDHSASADVEIEIGVDEYVGKKAQQFLEKKYHFQLNPAQRFAAENIHNNVVMVASTGSGKTEACLLWADEDKTFITLPLRVSLNAMYERLNSHDNVNIQNLGLLHSGSYDFLVKKDALIADESYQVSKQLSQKVTLSTIDQILKFPFLYRGFEKELATMAYSKVVIDEIQSYDPHIAAMLIKALEMIALMGGKFMVMTATLPKLYMDELHRRIANFRLPLVYGEFPNDDLLRHRIKLVQQSVIDIVETILTEGQTKKVLVICNTVDRAISVYEKLQELNDDLEISVPIRLLHARFIQKHKLALEQMITSFAKSGWHLTGKDNGPGIWVTTQVVEASVDVDFDILYTEACTLDSLFQRMGRCYRIRSYKDLEPNVHILLNDVAGIGTVYDKQLTNLSIAALEEYDGKLMLESEKMELVRDLFSREKLIGTEFLKKFESALFLFDNMRMFELSSSESQQLLREITTIEIIPPEYWDYACEVADAYETETIPSKRRELRRKIEELTVPINVKSLQSRKIVYTPWHYEGLDYFHWISEADVEYDFDENTMTGSGLKYKKSSKIEMY